LCKTSSEIIYRNSSRSNTKETNSWYFFLKTRKFIRFINLSFLEELVDTKKREKLWNIYLDKTHTNKDQLKRAEIRRIKNIEKQLAVINRTRLIMNDILITPATKHFIRRTLSDSPSRLIPNLSLIEKQIRTRRRSSCDQQIIERWKSIVDESKAYEKLSWPIRKGLIRRHFRRYRKNSSKTIPMTDSPPNHEHLESLDDQQCRLLSPNPPPKNNLPLITRKSNERLNPYITYFHLPLNENFKSNIQDFPLVTMRSDHHIIHINHDEC
jgi:hypothetical protein